MMDKEKKNGINCRSNLYFRSIRFIHGFKHVLSSFKATALLSVYTIIMLYVLYIHKIKRETWDSNGEISLYMIEHTCLIIASIIGGIIYIYVIGAPYESWSLSRQLYRIGLVNKVGEAPYLISKTWSEKESSIAYEFLVLGISLERWEENVPDIENAMNVNVIKIKQGKNRHRIVVYAMPYKHTLPSIVWWDDRLIPLGDFPLVLGEGLTGRVYVDLNKVPHILIGGSTGSGKSVLLKCLLWECMQKDAKVYIADFKGGVDFTAEWKQQTKLITDMDTLIELLSKLVEELELRKGLFNEANVKNILEFNSIDIHMTDKLPRIIFACDEVAEMLDKTGANKEMKEKIAQVESKLATIARQGRAFGINLILATQRPDANILSGQIRNNIDCRICGRADDVLSKIILDNTEASEKIPKDEQGLFLTNDGTVIRGYLFNDDNINLSM